MAYLYRHIRHDKDEPFYIGIGTDINGRYKRAREKFGRNKIWKDIVAKTTYHIEIMMDDLSIDEAHIKEIYFIGLYGKKMNGGVLANITDGGEGCVGLIHSEETKRKIAAMKIGTTSPMKGKISKVRGEKHGMFGKTHRDDLKTKWSIERKGAIPWNVGNKWGENQIVTEEMKNAQVGRRIEVYQYDMNDILINKYPSLFEASLKTGIRRGNISHCIKGNRKSSGGFKWAATPLE